MVYPDFIGLVDVGEKILLFGLPVASASYAYSVIPVIMMAWVMTYVEKLADKITPAVTKNFNTFNCPSNCFSSYWTYRILCG